MNIERSGEVAVLRMRAGKANAIGPAFLEQLGAQLDGLADAGALVLTGYEGFFSAGLDLPALLALGRAQMSAFIDAFAASMLRVFELPLPVVAAVNGHAVAGGCVLALTAHQPHIPQGWGGGNEIAIHSTLDPTSIGQPVSLGCIRADTFHMRKLMKFPIPIGTIVRIRA